MEVDQGTPSPQKWSWKWTRVPPSPSPPPESGHGSGPGYPPPEVVMEVVMEVDQGTPPHEVVMEVDQGTPTLWTDHTSAIRYTSTGKRVVFL